MRAIMLGGFLLILSVSTAGAQGGGRAIGEVMEAALSRQITPGGVVAVIVRDSVAFVQAYGRTGFEQDSEALTPDAVFKAGSLSEVLNALAAVRLADSGALKLDVPLGTVIPELPRQLRDVTVEQLITHTGGLAYQIAVPGRGGADDLGAAARGLTPLDRIATGDGPYSFSAPGIQLVGLAIERVSKQPYAEAMQSAVLQPLGMHQSTFDFAAARANLTPGWDASTSADARVVAAAFSRDTAMRVPLRGFHTTAADAARLAAALLSDGVVEGERVLPAGVAASLLEPRTDIPFSSVRAGRGVRISTWRGRSAVTVSGGSQGHGIWMQLLPAERLGVVLLTNKSGVGLADVADFVFSRLLGDAAAPPRPAAEPPDSSSLRQLASHPGRYLNGAELIEIVVQDGSPMLKSGELMLPVRPLEGGGLGALLDNRVALRFHFVTDADGRPYLWLGNRALALEQPK